eukprot:TRINITY_DN7638_c0_g1_i3.p1 TRINITY_DN7638_c0_g1~~TRINITY_DN7638_c0_g1_i3.p1  ORF type:complete len:306 (-),score=15.29 TRINITY_DN7638_c0_g1_i3:25-942(-)
MPEHIYAMRKNSQHQRCAWFCAATRVVIKVQSSTLQVAQAGGAAPAEMPSKEHRWRPQSLRLEPSDTLVRSVSALVLPVGEFRVSPGLCLRLPLVTREIWAHSTPKSESGPSGTPSSRSCDDLGSMVGRPKADAAQIAQQLLPSLAPPNASPESSVCVIERCTKVIFANEAVLALFDYCALQRARAQALDAIQQRSMQKLAVQRCVRVHGRCVTSPTHGRRRHLTDTVGIARRKDTTIISDVRSPSVNNRIWEISVSKSLRKGIRNLNSTIIINYCIRVRTGSYITPRSMYGSVCASISTTTTSY